MMHRPRPYVLHHPRLRHFALAACSLAAALVAQPATMALAQLGPAVDAGPAPALVKSVKAKRSRSGVDVQLAMAQPVEWSSTVRPDGTILVALDNTVGRRAFAPLTPSGNLVSSVLTREVSTAEGSLFQVEIRPQLGAGPVAHEVTPGEKGLVISLLEPPAPPTASATAPATARTTPAPAPERPTTAAEPEPKLTRKERRELAKAQKLEAEAAQAAAAAARAPASEAPTSEADTPQLTRKERRALEKARKQQEKQAAEAAKAAARVASAMPPPSAPVAPGALAPAVGGAAGADLQGGALEDPVPTVTFEYTPEVEPYRIGAGDTLALDVFGIAELKRDVEVGPDGRIALPILGRLPLDGLTLEEAEATIEQVLRDRGLATTPEVFLGVSDYESQGVFVQGAVGRPGIVQIPGGKRVMELLSEVGGLSQRDPAGQRIFILRTGENGEAQKMVIDAAKLLAQGDFSLNVLVLPGDLVMVPEPSKVQVFVSGAVQNPGPVSIDNGTGLTVLQAITAAGGPTPRAKLQNVSIIRRNADGSQETIDVNVKKIRNGTTPDVVLQNGDSVVVKEWFF